MSQQSPVLFQESSETKYKNLVLEKLTRTPQLDGLSYEEFYNKYKTLLALSRQPVNYVINDNIKAYDEFTPLIIAVDRNLEVLANAILDREGAKEIVNFHGQRGITALHCAARNGNLPLVKRLISMGASCDVANAYEHTSLHFAAMSGNVEVLQTILPLVDQDMLYKKVQYTNVCLHLACESGNAEAIKLIAEKMKPEDLTKTGVMGHTPLILACEAGSLEGVKYLLSVIPNPKEALKETNAFGRNLLAVAAKSGNLELYKMLKKEGLTDHREDFNHSTLESAIEAKNPELVKYILQQKSYPPLNEDVNCHGLPLIRAVECGVLETVKLLVEEGADVNLATQSSRDTPLDVAIDYGQAKIADYLKSKGATTQSSHYELMLSNIGVNVKDVEKDEDKHIDPDENYNPLASVCCIM